MAVELFDAKIQTHIVGATCTEIVVLNFEGLHVQAAQDFLEVLSKGIFCPLYVL